ncbi:MAG: NRDE family protein [Planctomycetota bacterium]|nr:NRDE family protein [Planctomycetota bacterium]MEC9233985.1 NRDE family protein [Planctomycetota bacterium]
MCTLTILPRSSLGPSAVDFRVAFSRDEQRDRTPGTPPRFEDHDGTRSVLPRDPQGGGTWIAVTEHGLVFCLLNVNPRAHDPSHEGGLSRGRLIPGLLPARSLAEVGSRLPALAEPVRRPFRLVVTDGLEVLEATGAAGGVTSALGPLEAPFMRCSSGLGDHVVEPLREEAFDRMLPPGARVGSEAQDAYHRLRFEGRDDCSVDMSRADALTVSWTVIEVDEAEARLSHHPAPPRESPTPESLLLPMARGSGRRTAPVVDA